MPPETSQEGAGPGSVFVSGVAHAADVARVEPY